MRRVASALFITALALPSACGSTQESERALADSTPSPKSTARAQQGASEKAESFDDADESAAVAVTAAAPPRDEPAPRPVLAERKKAEGTKTVSKAKPRRQTKNVARGDAIGAAGGALAMGATGARVRREVPMRKRRAPTVTKDRALMDKEMHPATEKPAEHFKHAGTNPFTSTMEDRLSTFAIDVDTGSYTYARQYLKVGNRPQAASVRVEEWVNAFHYDYEQPQGEVPFAVNLDAGPSPFHAERHLVRVGIQGKTVTNDERKPIHVTFLVDVSGSMSSRGKLDMVKKSMDALVKNLRDDDSVAIVTYAGRTEEVLAATKGSDKRTIFRAIADLRTGGGTNMGSGMELAYRNANKFLGDGRNARVVVMSDGDANIGRTRHGSILNAVKGYVSEGVTLSTVGYGTGNYNDHLMEQLANAGNGNYSYIDGQEAIDKIFGQDLVGTLEVIAKDVKIQVEFNPSVVNRYRLIGYENRDVADKDFRNDKVDAGEIGAGHSVTALYEVELTEKAKAEDLATVRIRYKQPRGVKAKEVSETLTAAMVKKSFGELDANTRMATALAVASEHLRGSEYATGLSLEDARALAAEAVVGPFAKERRAFVSLLSHDRLGGTVSRR